MMSAFQELLEQAINERADLWETLGRGSNKTEREMACILRSIVSDIEGPHPVDWLDIRKALYYLLGWIEGKEKQETRYDGNGIFPDRLTDSSTWQSPQGWKVWIG